MGRGSLSWKVDKWRRDSRTRMSQPGEAVGGGGQGPRGLQKRTWEGKGLGIHLSTGAR